MEIFNPCMKCMQETGFPSFMGKGNLIEIVDENIDIDTFLVEMTCDNGHHTYSFLQAFKFELLFDFGMKEFVRGHYESAIFYFGVAKERFFWFFSKVASRKLNNEQPIANKFYKYIKNNSQMQEGIFLSMYSLLFNKEPAKFDDNIQKIRNKAIHKGELIKKEECEKYGKEVLKIIVETINDLKKMYPNFYIEELEVRAKEIEKNPEVNQYSINSSSTVGAIFLPLETIKNDFDSMVESYIKNKDLDNGEYLRVLSNTLKNHLKK